MIEKCQLCTGHDVEPIYHNLTGYINNLQFNIQRCQSCGAHWADPLESMSEIYNLIYSNSSKIGGYERYAKFYKEVQQAKDPLNYLANQENNYWATKNFLECHLSKKSKILEVGSGLGYLTYAIKKAGYQITGVDLSQEAVNKACQDFGDYYLQGDIHNPTFLDGQLYDAIIALELIEHLTDIPKFLKDLLALLKPGGKIFFTTPNKDIFPPNCVWQTDLPPVHLWWLTPKSLEKLADQFSLKVQFTDFSPFHSLHQLKVRTKWPMNEILPLPTFDQNKHLIDYSKLTNRDRFFPTRKNKLLNTLNWVLYQIKKPRKIIKGHQSTCIGITLEK